MSNNQYSTSITLPRGTLDLTYQTNSATNNGLEKSNNYQLEDLLGFAQRINPKRAFFILYKCVFFNPDSQPAIMHRDFAC